MNNLKEYYNDTFGSAQGMPAYEEWTTAVYFEMANGAGYAAWLQARAITAVGEKICEALHPNIDEKTGFETSIVLRRPGLTIQELIEKSPNTVFFQKEGIEKIFEAEINEDGEIVPGKLVLDFTQDVTEGTGNKGELWDIKHTINPKIPTAKPPLDVIESGMQDFFLDGSKCPDTFYGNAKEVDLPNETI